ncbi:hypothetical protein NGTWS1803_23260 [Mycolicibacterium cyprinidarum]|nr:hypothetical protein NGTWS1803_23260 [Mycolicibacterium sp. NGTWS1803]
MALRVVQWATGGVGVAAVKGVLEHPELELVGCWVHSRAKAGRDVGQIVGTDPLDVTATNSIEEILELQADAVIYTPLMANSAEVASLLRSGKNVVTPVGWLYPGERHPALCRCRATWRCPPARRPAMVHRWNQREVPVAAVSDVDGGEVCSRRGVFGPANVRGA